MRLIDADALIDNLTKAIPHFIDDAVTIAYTEGLGRAKCEIDDAPTIEPERKTGKWIEFESDENKYDIIKCSCCKHTFTVDSYHWTDIGFVKDDFNFCPNCGADMRGDKHG